MARSGGTTPPPPPPPPPATDAVVKTKAEEEAAKRKEDADHWARQTKAMREANALMYGLPEFKRVDDVDANEKDKKIAEDPDATFGVRSETPAYGEFPPGTYHREGSAYLLILDAKGNITPVVGSAEQAKADNYGDKRALLKEMVQLQLARGATHITLDFDTEGGKKRVDSAYFDMFADIMKEINARPGANPISYGYGPKVAGGVEQKPINQKGFLAWLFRETREEAEAEKLWSGKTGVIFKDHWLKRFNEGSAASVAARQAFEQGKEPEKTAAREALPLRGMTQDLADPKNKLPSNEEQMKKFKEANTTPAELEKRMQEIDKRLARLEAASDKLSQIDRQVDPKSAKDSDEVAAMSARQDVLKVSGRQLQNAMMSELADLKQRQVIYKEQIAALPDAQKGPLEKKLNEINAKVVAVEAELNKPKGALFLTAVDYKKQVEERQKFFEEHKPHRP